MNKYFSRIMLVTTVLALLGTGEIKAETSSIGYIGPTSATSSNSTTNSVKSSAPVSTDTNSSSNTSAKSTNSKSAAAVASPNAVAAALSSAVSSSGVSTNVQSASVQVEPYSGSAGLSIPIAVPPGRAGIQPNLALTYNSSERQLSNAGVGWTLDLGSIQRSTKKGIPTYNDSKDIFTMAQAGSTQDLVADPNVSGLYHMEVEGAFAKIQYFTTYWVITDKKGIKYYYGNTNDSKQNDTAYTSHIFRWALNRVEDLNGNYMTISYLQDNGQIYPQTISYTGNDQSSLNLSTYAQVTISYVAASSPGTSYISKFLVKTAQRIDHITVTVGPNIQSTYKFTYHQSANSQRDLLQSVQQTGADGSSTLPPVTFTYNEALPQWQMSSGWNIPAGLTTGSFKEYGQSANQGPNAFVDSGLRSVDVNGDGYADLIQLQYTTSGTMISGVYLNNHSNSQPGWTSSSTWQMPPVPGPFSNLEQLGSYYGLSLADLNGDGLADIVFDIQWTASTSSQIYQSVYVNNNTNAWVNDSSWQLPVFLSQYDTASGLKLPTGAEVADVDGDGFPDFVQSKAGNQAVYINQYPQGSKSFKQDSTYTFPSSYSDFTNGAVLVDLNGDGLPDILYRNGTTSHVFMNTGHGWVEDTSSGFNAYPTIGSFTNTAGYINSNTSGNPATTQMVDVNGDGLPDLVYSDPNNNGYTTILLNTGSGWVLTGPAAIGIAFLTDYTQFFDANGDGMMDFMDGSYLYLNQNQPVDLLTGINNGIGASTSIQYDSDLHFQNTYMPFFIPVVKSTTTTVNSQSYTTNYSYAGGNWDTNYREFDGFKTVTITDPNGNYVTSTFLQDHWLKGHPSEQDTYGSNGNLYSKSVNTWQTQNIATNSASNQTSKFVFVVRTDNYLYDGNSSAIPKRTAQEYTYGENPQYGDITQTINDGQVDPTAGTSIDTNKTTTQIGYVNNSNIGLLGLPSVTTTQDVSGNTISKTSFYYDGDATGSATPVLGRLTAKVNWLGSTTQPDPKTTYTYDAYGNLQTTTDPLGNTTTITYDNTVHMFPEQTSNSLKQTDTMTYYGIDTAPLNNGGLQGLWGQDRSKTDANNQTAYTTYDVFGRPVASISPLDSIALPTEQKIYNIQPTYISVTDIARVSNGSSATISSVSYYDGLGRLIETKSLGPTAGQYIVSGQTVYDNRGLPITKYLPYFTANNLNAMDPINASQPSSQAIYDPMGRIVTKTNPDGTYSSVTYNQWATTTTDENGHMQQSFVDAFGRLIQKQEYMGADGRSPNYPAAAYALYATTSYSYDPRGNLTSVMDAHNNVTTITYDNLGRKTGMNDPDMGKWQYGYDSNGNLIWQQDAKGQVISFKYDALNRLINKTDGINGPIVNLPNLTTQAPTFNVNYNFDDKTQSFGIGRLGSVSYDTGTAGFIYDQLGREITSNKNVAQGNYNVARQYDALNRLQQLQYPDGSQVSYAYNQAGQVAGVADAGAVINGAIASNMIDSKASNDRLAWFDRALGVNNAYAATSVSPTVSITSPVNNTTYAAPANLIFTASASETGGTIARVNFYFNGVYKGMATSSPYRIIFVGVASGTYSLTAVAVDSNGVSTTSSPVTVTVGSTVAPGITAQPVNVTVTAPATGTFTVTTSGTPAPAYQWMQSVSGGAYTNIAGATSASYTTAATTTANSGTKYECVVANAAGSVTSAIVTLTVNPSLPSEPPPTVSLAANSSTYAAPATVTLTATASQVSGTISRVDFYNGSTLIGSASSSPYIYVWSSVAAGNYVLKAQAYNNTGAETTSSTISIGVQAPNVYIQSINYNANGQITQIQYGNGAVTAYTYNPLNFRLTRIYTSNTQAQVIQDLNYTYDSVGQVMAIKDNVNTNSQTFAYDALNRLILASGTYGSKTYAYDSIGNITLKDGLTYTYSGAGPHAVTSLSDGSVFKYDANGNMISLQRASNLTQYAYDSQNRLQTVTVGGLKVASYAYDGDGGRTQKTVYRRDLALYNDNTNALLFGSITAPLPATAQNLAVDTTLDIGNLYESETAAGQTARHTKFIYLGNTRVAAIGSDGNVFYYHTDHLGGTNVLTDNTGLVRELTEYDPFGQVITHEKYGNSFATIWFYFTGKPLDDETGLIFLGARYYNPSLGRFITPDTVVQAPSNPQTLNRYTYCNNNPVNLTDPSGHSWFSKLFKAIGDFFSNLVKNPIQTIINIATIVIGVVTVNPVLVASGEIGLFKEGTSSFTGGAWNTIHQVLGYAQIGLAVVGGVQAISSAFSQAGGVGLEAGDGDVLESGANDAASSAVSGAANGASSLSSTVTAVNSTATSVADKVSLAANVANTSNNAGNAFTDFFKSVFTLDYARIAAGWTSTISLAVTAVAAATGDEPLAYAAFKASQFFGGLAVGSTGVQSIVDKSLREFAVTGLSYAVTRGTEIGVGSTSIYGPNGYFHDAFSQNTGDAAGAATECFSNQRC